MSENYRFYFLFIFIMKEYVVRNVSWLTKFTRGERVLTDGVQDSNGEVKVYKLDCDWDILRNDAGNKVSYQLSFNRLRPTDVDCQLFTAGTLEQRVMNKTFTDEALDEASDYIVTLNEFTDLTLKLRNKLSDIANKLLWKVNALTISSDAYDAEKFKKAMAEIKKVTELLDKKPMTDILDLCSKLNITNDTDEEYDAAADIL